MTLPFPLPFPLPMHLFFPLHFLICFILFDINRRTWRAKKIRDKWKKIGQKTKQLSLSKLMKRDQTYGIHRDRNTMTGEIFLSFFLNLVCIQSISWFNFYRTVKQSLIGEISTELNMLPTEITSKFHALRTQFNRELNKERKIKSGSSADESYVSRWEFKASLQFLKVNSIAGDTVSNLVCQWNFSSDCLSKLILIADCHFISGFNFTWFRWIRFNVIGTYCSFRLFRFIWSFNKHQQETKTSANNKKYKHKETSYVG